jgi:hypothetical protein
MSHVYVSMFHLSISMSPFHVSQFSEFRKWKTELAENRNFHLFAANRKTETANFRLSCANGNREQKFVFLGQRTINSNQ